MILDIGPKTIEKIKNIIENSKTVLWNGPAGYFENPNFAKGSHEIAKQIVKKNKDGSIYSVLGGGDTVALINQINVAKEFNEALPNPTSPHLIILFIKYKYKLIRILH